MGLILNSNPQPLSGPFMFYGDHPSFLDSTLFLSYVATSCLSTLLTTPPLTSDASALPSLSAADVPISQSAHHPTPLLTSFLLARTRGPRSCPQPTPSVHFHMFLLLSAAEGHGSSNCPSFLSFPSSPLHYSHWQDAAISLKHNYTFLDFYFSPFFIAR